MKKYNGISLIETLISLTIVGLSLIALLPVTTLRKDGNDPTHGNKYWEKITKNDYPAGLAGATVGYTHIAPIEYEVDKTLKISLGSYDTPTDDLEISNAGFANKDILPLSVDEWIRWNGELIKAESTEGTEGTKFSIQGGLDSEKTVGEVYPRNVYVSNSYVVIENNSTADTDYSFDPDNAKVGARSSTKFISIEQDGAEILVNDKTNNVIGIGKNATKCYGPVIDIDGKIIRDAKDLISIMHLGATCASVSQMIEHKGGLIIGAKPDATADFGNPANFYIYKPKNQAFQFNAHTNVKKLLGLRQILVASDKRLKNIYGDYKKGLDVILKLKPYLYTFKDDESKKERVGIMAQDLQKIMPYAVSKNSQTGYLVISTDPIFYALLNSIKELDGKNKELENENKKLEEKIAKLKKIRDELKASQGGNNEK